MLPRTKICVKAMPKLMQHQLKCPYRHSLALYSHQTQHNGSPEVTAIYTFFMLLSGRGDNGLKSYVIVFFFFYKSFFHVQNYSQIVRYL